ncbi:MAG TPA: hypothetical protein VGJ28_16090 [Micromonosporaceae bacterium]|jgi:hypothetical protein
MTPLDKLPFRQSRDLPKYRGILAVDAKGFTSEPSVAHQAISGLIPRLVGLAFTDIGLADVWNSPSFFGPTGDGFAVGVPTRVLPYLVHPFFDVLQRVLATHNQSVRHGEAQIRLRASLHVGPLPVASQPQFGGNGTPRNDTHRLLDSSPVRAILADARPEITYVAAIISDRIYEDVVLAGYAGRHPAHFVEVDATVPGKGFAQRAWLFVPEPSGNLLKVDGSPPPTANPVSRTEAVPGSVIAPPAAQMYQDITTHGPAAFGNQNTINAGDSDGRAR